MYDRLEGCIHHLLPSTAQHLRLSISYTIKLTKLCTISTLYGAKESFARLGQACSNKSGEEFSPHSIGVPYTLGSEGRKWDRTSAISATRQSSQRSPLVVSHGACTGPGRSFERASSLVEPQETILQAVALESVPKLLWWRARSLSAFDRTANYLVIDKALVQLQAASYTVVEMGREGA